MELRIIFTCCSESKGLRCIPEHFPGLILYSRRLFAPRPHQGNVVGLSIAQSTSMVAAEVAYNLSTNLIDVDLWYGTSLFSPTNF